MNSSRCRYWFAFAASVLGWLLSFLGLFPALFFVRAHCAFGGQTEDQIVGFALATIIWLIALGLLALGRRALGQTGWLGLVHAVAFVPTLVLLALPLWHSTVGGIALCSAFEESSAREEWASPATPSERLVSVATVAAVAAFAFVGLRAVRRGRSDTLCGPLTARDDKAPGAPRQARPRWLRIRHLAIGATMAVVLLRAAWLVYANWLSPQSAGSSPQGPSLAATSAGRIPQDAGTDAVTGAAMSDEERCKRATWPEKLRVEEPTGEREVNCHELFCRMHDACGPAILPSREKIDCGGCEPPRVCDPTTLRCCRRRPDAELCASCKSADEVLSMADCGQNWLVVCDGCCVGDRPLHGDPPKIMRLAYGFVLLEPGGRAELELSEIEEPATTVGTWRREGEGRLVAEFDYDTATLDEAMINFGCAEHVANDVYHCPDGPGARDCFAREAEKCAKARWNGIKRRFGKRSARFKVTVELERGPNGELRSRTRGRDPKPVPGKERFEVPGHSDEFQKTGDCFFVPR